MKNYFLIILVALLAVTGYTQDKTSVFDVRNVYDEKGDYYFEKKNYKKAIVYYNMAYAHDPANYYSLLKKAQAFTRLGLFDQAAESYRILFLQDLYIPNEYQLQYALLLLKNKDISGFEKQLTAYNAIVHSEIHDYIGGASQVRAKMYTDSSILIVENENVLNSSESEIAPTLYGNQLIFASTRKNTAANAANSYYNMYSASYRNTGRLGKLNSYNTSLNSTQNELAVQVSPKGKSLYVTRGNTFTSGFQTYTAPLPAGRDSKLQATAFNLPGVSSIGQVSFTSTGTTMYFVSESGGNLDIYTSEFQNGKWGAAKKLGSHINTDQDEIYPFVLHDTLLYFASKGHSGLGGFDLFELNLKQEGSKPKNLGSTVNSTYDEYGLTFSPEGLTGYFCSNRPGGFGKEDIYRLHRITIKTKLAAYKFKKRYAMEDDKINLYLSSGEDYNIAAEGNTGFHFGFQPQENYKIVVRHENALASNIIYNSTLSTQQREKAFLKPAPLHTTDIPLEPGMRYQFTAGMKPLSEAYKNSLNELAESYNNPSGGSAVDLTALAKELLMNTGEVYTIEFVMDDDLPLDTKSKEVSSLFVNGQTIDVSNKSFFIVLPLDIEANFNIKTDIGHFKESYSPKKVGALKVDAAPVLKESPVKESEGFPILVNTSTMADIQKGKKIPAKELSIVPGTMYIFSLSKPIPETGETLEIVVPLTKGVQYNLGTEGQNAAEYNKALTQMNAAGSTSSEELIDISVLSKELDIVSNSDIVFNLIPAKKLGSAPTGARNVLTTLTVDGRRFFVTEHVKLQVNLKLDQGKKVNLQTDLAYVKENFEASTIALNVDNTSFASDVKEAEKNIITDPVFDVIVVNFDLNEYAVRPDAKSILVDKVIKVLQGDSRLYVTIKGYTDGLGNTEHNKKLSSNRAHAVKDFLSNNGIGENRIRTFSFGESMTLDAGVNWEDLSEAELKKHRKVEIVIYLPK